MPRRDDKPGRGFTILELTITLAVIALVASFAIPAYFARSEVTLENACVLLARDLRLVQNSSAAMGRNSTIEFDADGNGYRVVDKAGQVLTHPRNGRPFQRRFNDDGVFEGVRVQDVDLLGGRVVTFTVDGRALQGGTIELGYRGDLRAVEVERGTGFIKILGTTSGWSDDGL